MFPADAGPGFLSCLNVKNSMGPGQFNHAIPEIINYRTYTRNKMTGGADNATAGVKVTEHSSTPVVSGTYSSTRLAPLSQNA